MVRQNEQVIVDYAQLRDVVRLIFGELDDPEEADFVVGDPVDLNEAVRALKYVDVTVLFVERRGLDAR